MYSKIGSSKMSTGTTSRKRSRVVAQQGNDSSKDHDDDNDNDDNSSKEAVRPCVVRNCDRLYASRVTLSCALRHGCVPCAYKIGCFDVALDKEFCRQIPNQRPELCPRRSFIQKGTSTDGTLGWWSGGLSKVLTVGDGDFSFSLAIARIISRSQGLIATSYESRETLVAVYPRVEETMSELEALGVTLFFQVDATNIKATLPPAATNSTETKFDRIVWNFPCEAVAKGQDGQNKEMERNKALVRKFVDNARHLLDEKKGQIHINHKTKPPFNQWNIEDVAVETSQAEKPPVYYYGRIAFDRYLFPGYVPRKALDKKSFPSHDACTYVFGLRKKKNPLLRASVQYDDEEGSKNASSSLITVDERLLLKLRAAMLSAKKPKRPKRR